MQTWLPIVVLAVLQSCTVYFHKRAAMTVGKYPYVLALTQPMFTSTFFGVCCFLRHVLCGTPKSAVISKYRSNHGDGGGDDRDVPLLGSESKPTNADDDHTATATANATTPPQNELWGGTGRCGAMRTRTWFDMVAIGVLLTIHNFCMFAGSRDKFVAGPLLVLLEQAVVPVTMVASYATLGSRYSTTHVVGVVLVLAGIAASSGPQLKDASVTKAWAAVLVVLAQIPRAIALVIMERVLKKDRLELFWVWMWANVFELLAAIPLTFANLSIMKIPANVTVQEPEVLDCTNGFVWFIIFVLFVVAAKAAFAVVMISGSASLVWVAATAAVPLADLWFIAAPATRQGKSSWLYDVLGLVVVLFGLVLWHVKPETKKNT
eukprot:gene11297-21475_t